MMEVTLTAKNQAWNLRDDIKQFTGWFLGLRPANERRRYFATTSLIGWVQT